MNPYEILGISSNATEEEIKAAFRKLAKQNHPDLHSDTEREFYEAKMKKINEAYAMVMKNIKNKNTQNSSQNSASNDKSYSDSKSRKNNSNGYQGWEYYYKSQREYEQHGYDRYQGNSNGQYSYGTYKLSKQETEVFKKIMENAKVTKNILDTISEYTKILTNRSNRIIIRMREALQQYYDKVERYMFYADKIDKLTNDDYTIVLKFIKSVSSLDEAFATYLISSFAKVLDEEMFPVLKFTNEYLWLKVDISVIKFEINGFGSALKILNFVEDNLMGFASRSQLMYNANPICKKYDNSDMYLKYLANRFYMNCLMESTDYDIFSVLSRKNAFDDFIKEESLKDNKGPKLKLAKESK